ncbi:hypothetical protein GCM10011399_19190 [Subtercola lobariae]|uniref:SIP-like Rossmann fold domain-containing protein n=2 Tax=Subtercola lobariae TaxID=1588641 RepID=A0A917B6L9_9MICO|nr:hypothetical protein GCM10011399_19190 [Subtercola lobariae]
MQSPRSVDKGSVVEGGVVEGGVVGSPLTTGLSGQVLVAADETCIAEVRDLVSRLDAIQSRSRRTRGQIFIEVASAADIELLETPELITVTWLARDVRTGDPGTSTACAPGQALGRSVRAWVSEMCTGDAEFDGTEITAVVFGDTESISDLRLDLIAQLGVETAESAAL